MDPKVLKARDVMTPGPITVRSNLSLPELGAFLVENEISGAPVVDSQGCLVGVVSVNDLARAAGVLAGFGAAPGSDYFEQGGLRLVSEWETATVVSPQPFEGEMSDHSVSEIMSSLIDSVSADTSVSEIARIMVSRRHHRVLVTRDDQLLGIVTSLDLVALLLSEPDGLSLLLERSESSSTFVA